MEHKINEFNAQLDKLKQGFITELSDSEELPHYGETITLGAEDVLEQYLIRDIVSMVRQFLDWKHLDHMPLYSLPLRRFTFLSRSMVRRIVGGIVFFGRTDQSSFILDANGMRVSVSGHFPLLVDENIFSVLQADDHKDARYLIGVPPKNYPDLYNGVLFTWTKEHAKVIEHPIHGLTAFRILNKMLGCS